MRDLKAIIEGDIASRANRYGVELLNALVGLIDATPGDMVGARMKAQQVRERVYGNTFVRPVDTGPHVHYPSGSPVAQDEAFEGAPV